MSRSRACNATSSASPISAASTKGASRSAYRSKSMFAWTQAGCSWSSCVCRVSAWRFLSTASGAKNRKASKCVHLISSASTTRLIVAWSTRSGSDWCLCGCLGAVGPVEHGPLVEPVAVPDRRPLARRGERRAAALQGSEALLGELSRIVRAAALDAAPEPFSVVLRCLDGHAYRWTPSPEIRGRAQDRYRNT